MPLEWRKRLDWLLQKLRLKPLSLAGKCRLQFGAAILFSLTLALLVPYLWMNKLAEKSVLDSGRAVSLGIYEQHFRIPGLSGGTLPRIDDNGSMRAQGDSVIQWYRLDKESQPVTQFHHETQDNFSLLQKDETANDIAWISKRGPFPHNMYLRLVRAREKCLGCHNAQGAAIPFNKNQPIGVLLVQTQAAEYTMLLNCL
jgi:hypothetical protein